MDDDPKQDLRDYLLLHADALRWKLDGLSEHDVRRPLTPTGTNLLGLVKHLASVTAGYLGEVFDRPFDQEFPWFEPEAEPNADMFATAEESRADVLDLHDRAWAHASATIDALALDSVGHVPWWGMDVTLHRVLVHLMAETARHCGHADILREGLDGRVGTRQEVTNIPGEDELDWPAYHRRLQAIADEFT